MGKIFFGNYLKASGFQSTRPRGARPGNDPSTELLDVSIHAPTRGATYSRCLFAYDSGFNPRAHAGRDGLTSFLRVHGGFQSTRPRGARRQYVIYFAISNCFNPRAHAGRDVTVSCLWQCFQFQSTRPRGARPQVETVANRGFCFNPRAHAGRDVS